MTRQKWCIVQHKAIEDIKYAFDELKDVEQKYDYDKLPKEK
ncbi:hypothetical protein QO076_00830 [Campylobacter coli]|nr:hypothetical protein [Campylobacter coli]MDN2790391.1 hypothetical protein [Campylobacter coli]MDN2795482.1 hypothetical protein [Campylobacter jejuni]